jgi:hypothetical protein
MTHFIMSGKNTIDIFTNTKAKTCSWIMGQVHGSLGRFTKEILYCLVLEKKMKFDNVANFNSEKILW